MNKDMRNVVIIIIGIYLFSCQRRHSLSSAPSLQLNVYFDEGLQLYGGYYFSSYGGSISKISKDDIEIIPQGSVITKINPNFIMGYYEGEGYFFEKDRKLRFKKIFFCIHKNGQLEFGLPYVEDGRVMGEVINSKIFFGR